MAPTPVAVQRKQGVGLLKPVSWNNGRRFTSPGPGPLAGKQSDFTNNGTLSSEVSVSIIIKFSVKSIIAHLATGK